jgi:hypothetical protein
MIALLRKYDWLRPLVISSVVVLASRSILGLEILLLSVVLFFFIWFPRALVQKCPDGLNATWWKIEKIAMIAMLLASAYVFNRYFMPPLLEIWNMGGFNPWKSHRI